MIVSIHTRVHTLAGPQMKHLDHRFQSHEVLHSIHIWNIKQKNNLPQDLCREQWLVSRQKEILIDNNKYDNYNNKYDNYNYF